MLAVMALNSCGASMASVANNGKGFNTGDEVACAALDAWAVAGMLRSPVPWIQSAGYAYGGLSLLILGAHWVKKFDSEKPAKAQSEKNEKHPQEKQ